jgi:hypothetical protein
MHSRCSDRNSVGWANYGGRGIVVCERWHNFAEFLKDMGKRPGLEYSIDRINVNGNYEPGNCRWATVKQQQRNRRNNVVLTYAGQTKTIAEWVEITGLSRSKIESRIKRGMPVGQVLALPPGANST